MMEEYKTSAYKKNYDLEKLLQELNTLISTNYPEERQLNYPVMFVVGTPRSGTTLLTQWLASLDLFCYPTNFVSRFYANPFAGFLIQEMLYNKAFSYKNELQADAALGSFSSDVGKTTGPLEPHEFWYFWRQHFTFPEVPVSETDFLKTANFETFIQQIAKVQTYFNRPFFLKSLIINWYIETFHQNLPNALFLYIKRDPLDNMQSLLNVRKRYLGDEELWFSFKPKEYERVVDKSKYVQVAGQVEFTNREIEKHLAQLPKGNKIEIDYRTFCEKPEMIYRELREKLYGFGITIPETCPVQKNFSESISTGVHGVELIEAHQYIKSVL